MFRLKPVPPWEEISIWRKMLANWRGVCAACWELNQTIMLGDDWDEPYLCGNCWCRKEDRRILQYQSSQLQLAKAKKAFRRSNGE